MKKAIDAAAVVAVANDIESDCMMLGFVDEESIDDVDFYVSRIKSAAWNLRKLVRDAEPINKKGLTSHGGNSGN